MLKVGGVERGTVDVAGALVDAGWNAVVASSGGSLVADIEAAGAAHVTLPMSVKNPFGIWRNVARLGTVISRHRVDIVHARSRAPAWSAYLAARRAGASFVTTVHGLYSCASHAKRIYNSVMIKGDRVIAVSEFVKDHLISTYPISEDRLRVIPPGVDSTVFDPARVSKDRVSRLRSDLAPSVSGPVIMLPARPSRIKGQDVLVEAVQLMGREDVHVMLLGAEDENSRFSNELRNRIRKVGMQDRVRLTPVCRDMPAAYMLADIVVSASSKPEAFGRISIEAQAMGRPVVATALGGSLETVRHGETGWLVPSDDPAGLALALDRILRTPADERRSMGERARNHVKQNFSNSRILARTVDVYRELLHVSPPV